MAVSRIRKAQSQREHDGVVDDFVTQGYQIIEQGEATTMLRKKTWGSLGAHVLVALLTVWWTFGIGNVLYGVYAHYAAEKIMVKIDQEEVSKTASFGGPREVAAS